MFVVRPRNTNTLLLCCLVKIYLINWYFIRYASFWLLVSFALVAVSAESPLIHLTRQSFFLFSFWFLLLLFQDFAFCSAGGVLFLSLSLSHLNTSAGKFHVCSIAHMFVCEKSRHKEFSHLEEKVISFRNHRKLFRNRFNHSLGLKEKLQC